MNKLTMRNTKQELFNEVEELQAQLLAMLEVASNLETQLATVTTQWAEAQQLLDEASKYGDEVTEELRHQAALAQAAQTQAPSGQAPARPVTDRGAILATMREYAVAHKCPTRLRDGVAQYYSYQVNTWLAI